MTLKLNISTKNLNSHVQYHKPHKTYTLNDTTYPKLQDMDFLIETIEKGVIKGKERKKLKKILKLTYLTGVAFLIMTNPTFAATTPTGMEITPTSIHTLAKYLISITTVIGVGMSMLAYQMAGGLRLFRKNKVANEWSIDIKKGFMQIVLSPFVFSLLWVMLQIFLGHWDWASMLPK